jgi:hypothetical protein
LETLLEKLRFDAHAESSSRLEAGLLAVRSPAELGKEGKLFDRYAARSVELLRQAVAKGYKDIDHLKKDDDLKALRGREDYKKLLKELEEMQ